MVLRHMVSYSWVCLLSFPVCYHKPLYPSVFSFQIVPSFLGTNDADMHLWKNLNVSLFLVVKYCSYISYSNVSYRSVKMVSLWSVDSGNFRVIFFFCQLCDFTVAVNLFYRILWDSSCLLFMERSTRVHFCIHPGLLAVCVSLIESMKRKLGQAPGQLIEQLMELQNCQDSQEIRVGNITSETALYYSWIGQVGNIEIMLLSRMLATLGTYVCPFLSFCFSFLLVTCIR